MPWPRARHFVEERGALAVHAFDQPETLLGQGGLGREIEADLPGIDSLLVAVGGGGLIGGIAAWFRGRVKVVAVEPEGSPTLWQAFEAGHPVDAEAEGIAADSARAPPGRGADVSDRAGLRRASGPGLRRRHPRRAAARWDRLRLVAGTGGAAAFAALLSGKYVPGRTERVAVLLCGANTDAVRFG